MNSPHIRNNPWDSTVFGIDCFEITLLDENSLAEAAQSAGHYTIKVDPLTDKSLLHRYGFYYTDTLVEPSAKAADIVAYQHDDISISEHTPIEQLLPMCDAAFLYGRFHRDFNLSQGAADQRYKVWLQHLANKDGVMSLCFKGKPAGFIAHSDGSLLLHAIDKPYRGKGLAKHFWSQACGHLASQGIERIHSSISAGNLAVLNLYASLGFRFTKAVDVYHLLTR